MKSQISKNIEDYMEDDLYGWGGGDCSVLTDKRSRERVKKHHTITTDYHHKKFTFSSKDFFSLTGTIDKDIVSG